MAALGPMLATHATIHEGRSASGMILASTPGLASGAVFHTHCEDPAKFGASYTEISIDQNPRITESWVRAEAARLGPIYASAELCEGGDMGKPPIFITSGGTLLDLESLQAAVTPDVQHLTPPPLLRVQ